MTIQDFVLSAGSMIFIIALLPTVFSATKPAITTSLLTGSTLAVFAATYQTLGFTYACLTTAASAALWIVIAAQTIVQRRAVLRRERRADCDERFVLDFGEEG